MANNMASTVHGYGAFDWGWWKYGALIINHNHGQVTSVYRDGVALYQSAQDVETWGDRIDPTDAADIQVARLRNLRARRVREHVYTSAAARFSSNFRCGNDRLSRAASAIRRSMGAWGEAADRDAAFDGGEFSGPACADAMHTERDRIERDFFRTTGLSYQRALLAATTARHIYFQQL